MYINEKLHNLIQSKKVSHYKISYKYHIIFWTIYFIFNVLRWGSLHNDFEYSLKTNLIGFPIHIALAYFNIYYLMPKFIHTKKYFTYVILVFLSLFLMLLVKFNLTYYLVSTNVMPEAAEPVSSITLNYAIITMLGELYVISFVTAIKITIDWLQEHSKLHELERRQMATELRFLRSQVSPHFFFNTLNNIYSLTLEKSNKAPEVVLKLSDLMRYLLYATKKRKEGLKKEVECIQNYIDLERIRFDDSLEVDVNITGNLENKAIAPMLLIPLVENCFKHGASKNIGKMNICVNINVIDSFLYFETKNTKPKGEKKDRIPSRAGGIGLSNVRKRLQLGYAPNEYEFNVEENKTLFKVSLKLKV
ncbi:sensor histidine kinase [Allomuricauda sp. SCSIO 65647]|uniref:sensor histidine kinase n=1 Tax=Allomuricauda sp. SCSIO 65647 TaxID=2908843 RepID=UPI001F2C0C2D|nr:histidine kinase [Muricauda sp. SCSIO 65647]UJH66350.1 histidine kinase [Muricauda sp. SCSIO 65647]